MILKVPGSTARRILRSRKESSAGPSVNVTVCDWPGSSVMRRNPLSSFGTGDGADFVADVQLYDFIPADFAGV